MPMLLAAHSMNSTLTPEHLHEIVADIAARFRVDVCTVYKFHEDARQLELIATKGLKRTAVGYRMSINQGLTGKVAREKRPVSVKHPATHPEYHFVQGSGEENLESYLGLPLLEFGQVRGVMVIQTLPARVFKLSEIEEFYAAGKTVLDGLKSINV